MGGDHQYDSEREIKKEPKQQQLFSPPSPFDGLPSHILESIISYLPVDEAARTSTLSQRWRESWTWVTHLNLIVRGDDQSGSSSSRGIHRCLTAREVDHILASHRRETLSSFRVALCGTRHCRSDVDRWVKFAERKGVQRLALAVLNCLRVPEYLRNRVLGEFLVGCESLTALELAGFKLPGPSSFQGSRNLKTLKLQNVELSERETIERIVSECVSLESLILRECSGGLVRFNFCSPPNLRLLELTQFHNVSFFTTVEIRAKNLQVLVSDMLEKIVKIDAPELQILSSGRVLFEEYAPLRRFEPPDVDDVQRKKLSSRSDAEFLGHYFGLHGKSPVEGNVHGHEFDKVQALFINLDLDDIRENILLAFILRQCTRLTELDIKIVHGTEGTRVDMANYWEKNLSPDSSAQRLKRTQLRGFTGNDLQLGFAEFLISKAPLLGELQIRFCKNATKTVVEAASAQLLSVPRASLDLRLILTD